MKPTRILIHYARNLLLKYMIFLFNSVEFKAKVKR